MSASSQSASEVRPAAEGHAAAAAGEAEPADLGARSRWRPAAAVALTLVALAPALAAVIVRFGSDYVPVQDLAIIDLRVRDVWSSHIPLVGPYSKGWSHPGPLLFWLLALPSGLFGRAAWATPAGGALLQAVAIAGSARLAWRKGGLALLLVVLAVLGLAYGATGGWMVLDAWNPNIAYPFFVLYVLVVWELADGAPWAAVLATAVGTFLVQTHVGYLPLVVVPAAIAVAVVVLDARRAGEPLRRWAGALRWSLVVGFLLWLPALVEQVVGSPGNLTRMFRYFTGDQANSAGLRAALEVLAAEFRPPPPWLGGEGSDPLTGVAERVSMGWLLVPVALFAAGAVAVRRSRDRSERNLLLVLGGTFVAGVLAIRQVPAELDPYLFHWRVPLALLVVAATGLATAGWLGLRRWPWLWRGAGAVLAGTAVIAWTGLAQEIIDAPEHLSSYEVAVADAADQLEQGPELRAREQVLLRFEGSNVGGLWGGLVDELDRRGARIRVDPRLDFQYGSQRTASIDEVAAVWYAVDDGHLLSLLSGLPDAEVVAEVTPLSAHDEDALTAAQRRLAAGLLRADLADRLRELDTDLVFFALADVRGLDHDDLTRVGELNAEVHRRGPCRCGVVAFPPNSPSLDRVRSLDPD